MTVHANIARALRHCGVGLVFGLMGDGNMHHLTDFVRDEGGRLVTAVHEAGAVSMADGYARATGGVGVVSITHGPALTNAVTALATAVRASTPLVVLTGATPARRGHSQHIGLESVARSVGADYVEVRRATDAVDDVAMALTRVLATRVPLVLDVPLDIQMATADYAAPAFGTPIHQAIGPDPDALDRALGIMASARRPVVLAGRGAAVAGAREVLIELADQLGAALGTTLMGRDLFRGHEYDLGIIGTLGTDAALTAFGQADVVIAFGAGLNAQTTANGGLFDGKAVVHCDLSAAALERHTPADVTVQGDALAVGTAMVDALREAGTEPSRFRTPELAQALREGAKPSYTDVSTDTTVDMRTAVRWLDDVLPEDRMVVTDTGRFLKTTWTNLHVAHPRDFVHTGSFGSMGLGMASAIGAAVARPDQLCVSVVGDGGAMMNLGEFNSAVRNGVPLLVVVLNDSAYGAEYFKLRNSGVDPTYAQFDWPEFAEVARALGGDGVTVRCRADLDEAAAAIKDMDRALLIDVKVDPSWTFLDWD